MSIVAGSMTTAFLLGIETAGDVKPIVNGTRAGGAVIEGDLNGNGFLDREDLKIAEELAKGLRSPLPSELAADPNQDFIITEADVLWIRQKLEKP